MKSISRKRPSAAMIVAVVALSLGLGGSAVAGSGVLSKGKVKAVANKGSPSGRRVSRSRARRAPTPR